MYVKAQYRTKNDRNGNPRRVWVLFQVVKGDDYARRVVVFDEGYAGAPRGTGWDGAAMLPPVDVTPTEYRDLVRSAHNR